MPHAHPSGFPSPSSVHSNARGGQAPALREKTSPLTVGLGPSDATRASERVSLAIVLLPDPVTLVGKVRLILTCL